MKAGIIMPCFAPREYVRQSVESILNQEYRDFLFLIIEDSGEKSVRDYLSTLSDPRIELVLNDGNEGIACSLNKGIRILDLEILFRMDADDIAHPCRILYQLNRFRKDEELSVLGSNMSYFQETILKNKKLSVPEKHQKIAYQLLWSNALNHSTVGFKRGAVLKAGGYDETLPCSQDYDLWTRMVKKCKFANISSPLLKYRIHSHQQSTVKREEKEEIRTRVKNRYRDETIGCHPSPLFNDFSSWSSENHPPLEEWTAWLSFLETIYHRFYGVRIYGSVVNPGRDLARRLFKSVNQAKKTNSPFPAEAYDMIRQLSPLYALTKGLL